MSTLTSGGPPPDGTQSEPIVAIPARHPGRWVAAAIVLLLAAQLVDSVVTNPRFEWGIVRQYVFDPTVLHGVRVTIELTISRWLSASRWAIVLAVMRLSPNPIVSGAAWVYIWFFRGTPLLVQLLFWGFVGGALPDDLARHPVRAASSSRDTNTLIPRSSRLCSGWASTRPPTWPRSSAAGILSVDEGQNEAAQALGMTRLQTMRRMVLPAGDAGDHPADRQRDDLDAEDHVAGAACSGYTELLYSVADHLRRATTRRSRC